MDEKIRKAKDMEIILDLIERPAEARVELDRFNNLALAFLKGLQTYVQLNKDKMADSYTLEGNISSLCEVLADRARRGR